MGSPEGVETPLVEAMARTPPAEAPRNGFFAAAQWSCAAPGAMAAATLSVRRPRKSETRPRRCTLDAAAAAAAAAAAGEVIVAATATARMDMVAMGAAAEEEWAARENASAMGAIGRRREERVREIRAQQKGREEQRRVWGRAEMDAPASSSPSQVSWLGSVNAAPLLLLTRPSFDSRVSGGSVT
jgi:hypothetical protein